MHRTYRTGFAVLALAALLTAQRPPPPPPSPAGVGAPAAEPQARPVPPAEPEPDADGFVSLFNGRDLTGWTPKIRGSEVGVNHGDTFRVADGVLQVRYDPEAYPDFGGRFGHLFHEAVWSRYVLRFEYRFVGEQVRGGPGWAVRNSGAMLHGQDPRTMTVDQEFPASIEAQLLGGDGEHDRTTLNLCTPGTHVEIDGKLVKRHCTGSRSKTYHGEQWVAVEIEVHGAERIVHRIDGEVVLDYRRPQLDPDDADAKRLIEARGGELLLDRGTISLQSESHPVDFRNIRIKPLPTPPAAPQPTPAPERGTAPRRG